VLYCINFTRWKQKYIHRFLEQDYGTAIFTSSAADAYEKGFKEGSQLVAWASKDQTEVKQIAQKWEGASLRLRSGQAIPLSRTVIWYMEDGFIRSAGLGSDLTAPASLVMDKTGIYYDPNKPSDLETILQGKEFTESELRRAESLKEALIANQLSKYNLGMSFTKDALAIKPNQKIVLIPGQVEDDASVQKGCIDIKTNTALIEAVRKNNPECFIIYKPHPDVVSGNRKGDVEKTITDSYCDLVLLDASITDCLAVTDAVHTMTSLVGFEALMRDLQVVCYGLPFYANWGLTEDFHQVERRTRKLKINELVHATLIDYPLYMNWKTSELTTPEVIVEQLKEQIEKQGGKQSNQVSPLIRFNRKVFNYLKGVFLIK
jgi:capsular polysaccharide export protein